ncbi:hypothetical protein ACF0H5_008212 [Mactra antiquata]
MFTTLNFLDKCTDLIGKHIIYDIYKYDRSWYDARVVCRSIGGDLADIVDTEDIDTVKQMNQAAGDFLSTKHYFSSAVRHTTDEYLFISDCKYVNGSLYTVTGDTGSPPDCLEAHDGHFHSVSSCKDDIGDFVCERKSSYKCYCTQDLQTDIVINEATSERECKQSCDQDGACWAAITTSTQCIKAMIPGFGLSSLNISIKSCPKIFEAYVNETIFQLPKDFVIDKPQHEPPTCTEHLHGNYPTYTVFTQERSWYDARTVCKSIGGDLAKIHDLTNYIEPFEQVNSEAGSFLAGKHFFTSAVKPTNDISEVLWLSDCTDIKNNSYEVKTADSQPGCLQIHNDHYHQVDCRTEKSVFLCETKAKDKPCVMFNDVETSINIYGIGQDDCLDQCNSDVTCWAAITTPSLCINAVVNGYGSSFMNISTKQCPRTFKVHLNDTNFPPPNINSEDRPKSTPPSCTVTNSTLAPSTTEVREIEACLATSTVMETISITTTSTALVTNYINITPTLCVSDATSILSSQVSVTRTISPTLSSATVEQTQSNTSWYNHTVDLNLIHPKNTSSYRRSLTSAMDERQVAMVIGLCGVTMIIIPLWAIILSDLRTIARHVSDHGSMYSKKSKKKDQT